VGFEPNENDLPMTIYALSIAVDWACNQLGIEDCVQRASNPYHLWMNDPANVDVSSDLRRIISCTAVTYGGPAEYAFIFKKYRESKAGSEKNDYLRAMTCTTDRTLISK